jgi:hypothetical protein
MNVKRLETELDNPSRSAMPSGFLPEPVDFMGIEN